MISRIACNVLKYGSECNRAPDLSFGIGVAQKDDWGGGVLLKKKLVERHFGQYDFILCEEQPPEWGSKGDKNVCKAAVLFPEQPI